MDEPRSLQEVDAQRIHQLADLIRAKAASLLSFEVEEGGHIIKMTFYVSDELFHHIFSIASNPPYEVELGHAERMMVIWTTRLQQLLGGNKGNDDGEK